MNKELLKHAQEYIEKMAQGINPITGEVVTDDDTLNNIKITRCLYYVNDVLKEVVAKGIKGQRKEGKKPFYLSLEELDKFNYYDNPVSITKIVQRINELIKDENMQHLKVNQMVNWLVEIGLLEVIEYKNKTYKRPTDTGKKLGMYVEHEVTLYREYDLVLYKKETQKFIIDNFNILLDYLNKVGK